MTDPMTIHLDLASPPKKATKEHKHERQHPTSKKHPSEGFGIAPKKGKKRTQARNSSGAAFRVCFFLRFLGGAQARDLASPPKKARQHLARHGKSG